MSDQLFSNDSILSSQERGFQRYRYFYISILQIRLRGFWSPVNLAELAPLRQFLTILRIKSAQINPSSHHDRIQVIDIGKCLWLSLPHFDKLFFADCWCFVQINPFSLIPADSFFKNSVLLPLQFYFLGIVFKAKLRRFVAIFILPVISILSRQLIPLFFSLRCLLLLYFSQAFFLSITLLFLTLLLSSLLVLLLLLSLFLCSQFSWKYLSLFDLKLKETGGICEEGRVGIVGGFPLIWSSEDALEFELQRGAAVGENDFAHCLQCLYNFSDNCIENKGQNKKERTCRQMTERQFKLRFPWLICQSKPEYPNSYQNIPSNICSFHSKNNIQTTTSTSSLSFLHFLPQRQQKNVVLDMIISLLSIYLQISKIITLSQMEDFPFKAQRHYTEIPTRDLYQQKKGFFRNYLRSQAKRFSSLVISNAITIEDNRIYFKIFMLSLEKPPSQRTQEDDLATCKVLIQENIFPEFHNDLNIVKMFAKQLMIKQVPAGHAFLTKSSKDDNLYKIIKGEVSFKKGKNGECMLKGKGEFIEKFQQFKSVKDFDVHCREETYFLVINFKSYEQGMKIYLQNKIILKMLMKIQIFQTLQRKEIACLLTKCQERVLTCKEQFFREGDFDNDMLYFLVQGEIVISKVDDKRKRQIVCYLGDGSLFGEQTIFLQKKRREYSAAVHSSQARVIQISRANINEMLTSFEHNKQQFYNNIQYKEYLQHKNQHYQQKLREAAQVKNIYSSFVQIKKPNNAKQLQMSSILREAENYAITLENKERILQKKNIFFKERKLISVDAPLFGRDDFPGYKHSMKRYEIYQAKAKENSCKLPQIN